MKKVFLFGLIFLSFMWLMTLCQKPAEKQNQRSTSTSAVTEEVADFHTSEIDSLLQYGTEEEKDSINKYLADQARLRDERVYGTFVSALTGEDKVITLENEKIRVGISSKGGTIESVVLKEYQNNYDTTQTELRLFDKENNMMHLTFNGSRGNDLDIPTKDLYFQAVNQTESAVTMRLKSSDGAMINYTYRLSPDSYLVDFVISSENLEKAGVYKSCKLYWRQWLLRTEVGRTFENRYSSLYYRFKGEEPDDDDLESSTQNGVKSINNGNLTWFSFKNQFFSSILISNDAFVGGQLISSYFDENKMLGTERLGEKYLKDYTAKDLIFDYNNNEAKLCFFFGPNNYSLLDDMSEEAAARVGLAGEDIELEHSVYLGWWIVRWVNRLIVLPFFHWLDSFNLNYGLIILLMTLLIKLITYPFTRKSMLSSAKMRIAQKLPEVQAIIAKYPNQEDAMKKQQEMMALYGRIGVNQMGGCIPMLLQWPVLIALFFFFPASIELRGQSFLWAHDLSTYDAILTWDSQIPVVNWIFHGHISLFCILMTVTNIFNTWMMQKMNPAQQGMPGMQVMMYLMPLLFLAILNDYSAGLSYYYFLSTLFSIVMTYAIRASLDEQKILDQMRFNLSNPRKKSEMSGCAGIMARAQEAQRQQQLQQKKEQKARMRKL